jgi:hypothetical protein
MDQPPPSHRLHALIAVLFGLFVGAAALSPRRRHSRRPKADDLLIGAVNTGFILAWR